MGNAFLLQHVPDHFAGGSADREDRNRFAAQRMHGTYDIDPAAAGIIARRRASQLVRRDDSVEVAMSSAGFMVIVTIVPMRTAYWAASERAAAACSASWTTVVVRNRLAALTLIESIPSSTRKRAISG